MKIDKGFKMGHFLLGGLIGSGLAVLLTTKKGDDLRRALGKYINRFDKKWKAKFNDLKNYTTEEIRKLKENIKKEDTEDTKEKTID